jgi:cytochrome oxidase Cu insertion factor (SCO1/SenC/PrrC family)
LKAQRHAEVFLEHIDRYTSNNVYLEDAYTGTPYNNPIFLLGTIYENNEVVVSNYALRYNAMADEIEVKETLYLEDSEAKMLTKSPDLYVKIMDEMFVFVPTAQSGQDSGYFQVLHVGNNHHLYKKITKKYFPARKARNSFEKDVLANYADRSSFYLVSKDGKFQEFGSSKNKRLKVFGDKQDDIKKYIQKGRLDINNDEDLLKIVKYYDTIELAAH